MSSYSLSFYFPISQRFIAFVSFINLSRVLGSISGIQASTVVSIVYLPFEFNEFFPINSAYILAHVEAVVSICPIFVLKVITAHIKSLAVKQNNRSQSILFNLARPRIFFCIFQQCSHGVFACIRIFGS